MMNCWRISSCVTALFLAGSAHGADWHVRQLADARFVQQQQRATDLMPSPDWIGARSRQAAYLHRWNVDMSTGDLRIKGQARLRLDDAAEDRAQALLDVLSAELTLNESSFAFAGRRHFVQGTALGLNPADVFLEPLKQDRTLNETRRRLEMRGVDALGLETLVSDRLTLSGFVAPTWGRLNDGKDLRAGVAAALLMPDSNMDVNALLFQDRRPGVALSLSSTQGNAWTFYFDSSYRRNRGHDTLFAVGAGDIGAFTRKPAKDGQWYFAGTLGAGLTLASGMGFNLEYSRQGDGYGQHEWREITGVIGANADACAGMVGARCKGRLLTLNGLLAAETLRRNYLFGRVSVPRVALLGGSSLEWTVLHGMDDRSGVLVMRMEKEPYDSTLMGLYVSRPYGNADSEFGLRSGKLKVGAYVTYRF